MFATYLSPAISRIRSWNRSFRRLQSFAWSKRASRSNQAKGSESVVYEYLLMTHQGAFLADSSRLIEARNLQMCSQWSMPILSKASSQESGTLNSRPRLGHNSEVADPSQRFA